MQVIKHGDRIKGRSKYYRLWCIWHDIKQRCLNSNNRDYKYYGGRGITIYEDWKEYAKFKNWALQSGYSDDLTIDRIDENGNYEPQNCRWATRTEQNRNKRSVAKLSYNGDVLTIAEWALKTGIPAKTIYHRIHKAGWNVEEALTTPIKKVRHDEH